MKYFEVLIDPPALSRALVAPPVSGAGCVVALAGAIVHAERDVEARHVVRHVAVEVQQHRAGVAGQLGDALNL